MSTKDTTTGRRVENLPLSELNPNPANPKDHHVATIDASVGRFGFVEPIVVDGRTGQIISGHGRTEALTAMEARGESPPEGITLDKDGQWLVPTVVGWSSRTDTEASAALVALNRAGELGGWVDESLLSILDDLSDLGDDGLDGVGYGEKDIADLRKHIEHIEPDLDDLADEWDGSDMSAPSSSGHTITVLDADLFERWTAYAEGHDTSDDALRVLLDATATPDP